MHELLTPSQTGYVCAMADSIIVMILHQQKIIPQDLLSCAEKPPMFGAEAFDINPLLHSLEST